MCILSLTKVRALFVVRVVFSFEVVVHACVSICFISIPRAAVPACKNAQHALTWPENPRPPSTFFKRIGDFLVGAAKFLAGPLKELIGKRLKVHFTIIWGGLQGQVSP